MAINIPYIAPPDLGGKDYSASLFNAASSLGNTIAAQRNERTRSLEFQQEQERLRLAGDRDYALELQKFQAGGGVDGVYGTPIPFKRADGSIGYKVIEKATGGLRELDFGEGGEPISPVQWLTTGPTMTGVDKFGNPVSTPPISRNLPEAAAQTEQGQRMGIARDALPQVEFQSEKLLGEIDGVMANPNLQYLTGLGGGTFPAALSTDPTAMIELQAKITQLVDESFLQAYNALRGAGAITEGEGAAAKRAQTVLGTQNMSDAAYVAALQKYRDEVEQMLNVARARAMGEIPPIGWTGPWPPDGSATAPSSAGEVITEGTTLPGSGVTLPGTRSTARKIGQ